MSYLLKLVSLTCFLFSLSQCSRSPYGAYSNSKRKGSVLVQKPIMLRTLVWYPICFMRSISSTNCSLSCSFANAVVQIIKLLFMWGGSVAEWLGRRTWNPEVAGSSPALATSWDCFTVDSGSTPCTATLVNSQLVCLLPSGVLCLIVNYLFLIFNCSASLAFVQ